MKSKWMTDAILKSINIKDKLYKKINQMDTEDEHLYSRLKYEFITHCTCKLQSQVFRRILYLLAIRKLDFVVYSKQHWLDPRATMSTCMCDSGKTI